MMNFNYQLRILKSTAQRQAWPSIHFYSFLVAAIFFLNSHFALAQKTGAINFNTPTSKLRYYDGTAWIDMGSTTSLGSCTRAGTIGYNVANNVMTYCDGTNEIDLTVQVSANLCSRAGAFDFDSGLNLYRFCNGTNWVNTATAVLNNGFFVMSNSTYTGNLGGRSGANSTCLTDLNANNWLGKSQAQSFGRLTASHVHAFLCDNSGGCLNLDASKAYKFARSGSATSGGANFTTNASGQGPGDSANWSGSTYFGVSAEFWTGRYFGTSFTLWDSVPDTYSCVNWTDGTSGVQGTNGRSNETGDSRWRYTSGMCNSARRLICVVYQDPKDFEPDSFSFTDLSNQAIGAQVSSNIQQITGFTGSLVVFANSVEPLPGLMEARICADSGCASVTINWTAVSSSSGPSINSGSFLQIRRYTAGNMNTARSVVIGVGLRSDTWVVTTGATGDNTPDTFDFTDLTNLTVSTRVRSDIVQITGIDAAEVTEDGSGGDTYPVQYRICADSACATVIRNWTSQASTIFNNQFIQLDNFPSTAPGSEVVGSLYVGSSLVDWKISRTPDTSLGAFVLLENTYNGAALGSLSNADAICLARLTADNFSGKLNVTLNSTTVKAFLCDNTTCNNLAPNTTYMIGSVYKPDLGGATFTTNASGQGPGDSLNWSNSPAFRFSRSYWTGRAAGTATLWSTASSGTTCSNWSVTTGNGVVGGSSSTNATRWNNGTSGCSSSNRLICFVNP